MQFYYVPLSLLALALSSTVGAQYGLTDIPNCARTAALTGITQTRCPITDLSCICKNQDWITKLLPDVEKACDDEDFQKTQIIAQKLCNSVGVTLTIGSSATGSATSPSGTSATAASVRASSATTGVRSSSSSGSTGSSSTSPTAAVATGDAAVRYGGVGSWMGVVGLAVGAMVWY